jgi:ATPase subunit of ABC transporter with duplicated ATPase domains
LRAVQATPRSRERKVKIRFPEPPHMGRVALRAEGLGKRYQGPPVFRKLSFEVERGERLLVMGLNGAGKTSLLRVLAGELPPDEGLFSYGHGVLPGYYAQEHEGLVAGRDVLSHMRELSDAPEPQLRSLLGMFGLTGKKAMQDVATLSGGEKTRLALAMLVAGRHNLLLLDEPTNNLDPPSRSAVAQALSLWPGSMIVVSHDTDFVAALRPGRILLMPEGQMDYWEDELLELVSLA